MSRKPTIHDPDTSTFNNGDIYDELRRARDILCRRDDKELGGIHALGPCHLEFVDRNICGRTREYVRYVYYARTRIRATSVPIIDYAPSHLCVRT